MLEVTSVTVAVRFLDQFQFSYITDNLLRYYCENWRLSQPKLYPKSNADRHFF